ncbi:hypothetical protein [Rhodococcus qingshengii]|uniref:hypothetical protein n=1 Tax=Rhodococcus qingshengii TaxID=334542 RepID=UPI001C239B25|nr:hypothetical protein [Rhodococcus qingshengii]QXC46914.1 hypothetical protein KSE96_33200 [Rhodococcus qingshengii]
MTTTNPTASSRRPRWWPAPARERTPITYFTAAEESLWEHRVRQVQQSLWTEHGVEVSVYEQGRAFNAACDNVDSALRRNSEGRIPESAVDRLARVSARPYSPRITADEWVGAGVALVLTIVSVVGAMTMLNLPTDPKAWGENADSALVSTLVRMGDNAALFGGALAAVVVVGGISIAVATARLDRSRPIWRRTLFREVSKAFLGSAWIFLLWLLACVVMAGVVVAP